MSISRGIVSFFSPSNAVRGILLGSTAMLLVSAHAAKADDLADLKAQIQLLNERLNQLQAKEDARAAQAAQQAAQQPAAPAQAQVQLQPSQTQAAAQAAQDSLGTDATPGQTLAQESSGKGKSVLGILTNPVTLYDDNTTSMHLYGIIEATVSGWSNQPNASGNNKRTEAVGFQTAWLSGNRLGFDIDHQIKAGEKIGLPGLKAIAKLETEFESPTGNSDTPGVLFNRDAWVGFESPDLGKLTFGRQNTVTRDFTQSWGDSYGTPYVTTREGGYSNVNNYKQIIYYSAASTLTRNDSAIVWKKPMFDNHVVIGLDYSFGAQGVGGSGNGGIGNSPGLDGGGGSPGKFFVGSNQAVSVAYNNFEIGGGKLSWNVNYNRANCGNFGDNHCNAADPSAGNYVNSNTNQAFLTGGTYVIDGWRVGTGYIHYTGQQHTTNAGNLGDRTDNVFVVNGTIPVDKKDGIDLYWGLWRAWSHNSALYAGNNLVVLPFFISTANSTKTVNGGRYNGMSTLMYHLDRQLDLYWAFDYQLGLGGWRHALFNDQGNGDAGNLGSLSIGTGTGFRFKF